MCRQTYGLRMTVCVSHVMRVAWLLVACLSWSAATWAQTPLAKPKLSEEQRKQKLAEFGPLWQSAQALDRQDKLDEAIGAAENALLIARQLLGDGNDALATMLAWLAERQERREDFVTAKQRREDVLRIKTRLLGREHWQVTDARLALANVELLSRLSPGQRRELAEAQQLNREVVRLHDQGKDREAVAIAERALQIRKRLLGAEHPDTADSLNNLALLYSDLGDFAKVERLYQQSLEIRRKVLGAEHPHTAGSLFNLAVLYDSLGDSAKAEPLFQQSLEIARKHLELAAAVQSERQQLAMTSDLRYRLDGYLCFATQTARHDEPAYRQLLAWKGTVFARQQMLRAEAERPDLKPLYDELHTVTRDLASLFPIRNNSGPGTRMWLACRKRGNGWRANSPVRTPPTVRRNSR